MNRDLSIRKAGPKDRPILYRLLQFYTYDFSEFSRHPFELSPDGIFRYGDRVLARYWKKGTDYHPYLLYFRRKLAGFVLVGSVEDKKTGIKARMIDEFHVLRRYRRRGIGRRAATAVFRKFPGPWEVSQIGENLKAQKFWRKVIGDYCRGRFKERTQGRGKSKRVIQSFVAPRR